MTRIPESLRIEHEQLHARLAAATREPGRTGETARTVARIMHPHFLREDEYAIPPLALLPRFLQGPVTPDMGEILPLVARVKEELPLMLEEHRAILGALEEFGSAAIAEGKPEWGQFADELRLHAKLEEEVLYPAAILVGEYVKAQLELQGAT
jgi:hypothetical protein